MSETALDLRHISKYFPGIKALDNVQFTLRKGEIHALLGENGAGKSTLIKVITGVHPPEEGEIFVNGKKVSIQTPNDARALGIAAIYQHVTAYQHLSVAENIFLGHESIHPLTRKIRWSVMRDRARKLLMQLGSDIDPSTPMGNLSVAKQQLVEIAKALSYQANILIMDEPTAALSKSESEDLYAIAKDLQAQGTSIIFISHRFEDVDRLADRITVFRDSQYIGMWDKGALSHEELVKHMVGREITQLFPKREIHPGKELFRAEKLGRVGFFKDISFTLHAGEILGLTGLVGAGRSEVAQCIYGVEQLSEGTLYLDGQPVKIAGSQDALAMGIGYLPEDRQVQGLLLPWSIADNIALIALRQFTRFGLISRRQIIETAEACAERLRVKAQSVSDPVQSLSGGNQQKVVLSKILTADARILILDEPTKGVDVGSKAAMYEIMGELAAQGYGILMISSEMPEILGMCDRIIVMREGRISRVLERGQATQESILEAALPDVHKV